MLHFVIESLLIVKKALVLIGINGCIFFDFRLLLTENVGGVCRDESIEGMRFYPNLFLTKA